mgnify:CR=1 FL=1
MEKRLQEVLEKRFHKTLDTCTKEELFHALMEITKEATGNLKRNEGSKKLYYISAEFLIGKLLSNNLINLGLYEETEKVLKSHGYELCEIEELEMEPSLGNGGLGRLAACFLDSIATLGLPGDGIGLNYHFGLFQQKFTNHKQQELKNPWITKESWLNRQSFTCKVPFKDFTMDGVLYDIDVPGYDSGCNRLHLFDVDTIDESIVPENSINFNKKKVQENLTLFLYPDDSDDAGRKLRIYQQYFMVSCGAQLILKEMEDAGYDLHELNNHAVIQINDTHPSMVIPELIRLLTEEKGFTMDEAVEVVSKTCAYTNHTILAEALEKWPLHYLQEIVPQLVPIIEILDDKVRRKYHNQAVYIIDGEERVHMAHIDIHYSSSVNGVASLHTEILKNNELHHFYEIYPEKFNNKTNGITFRRWLLHCNPQLTELITSLIGDGFKKDATQLEKLLDYKNDEKVLKQILEIKSAKKMELKKALMEKQNVTINENSIFDIQIKRLHEYKRQQLNALYVIHKYLEIKAGKKPSTPITVIFGAKAAPAYIIAQDIIHLILCLQQLINNDPEVSPYLNVVMVENYNVTWAEKLIPACDISEQISLASKEASGTGNMKFMLNGALTLGTEDGANVEIHELVGDDNIYIFGDSSDTVVERYAQGSYHAAKYYNENAAIKEAVDFITGEELKAIGDKDRLERLFNELVSKDWFMTFPDFDEYVKTREQAYADYENREEWVQKMLVNIAKAGYFSSDRTIEEYNRDIWKLED